MCFARGFHKPESRMDSNYRPGLSLGFPDAKYKCIDHEMSIIDSISVHDSLISYRIFHRMYEKQKEKWKGLSLHASQHFTRNSGLLRNQADFRSTVMLGVVCDGYFSSNDSVLTGITFHSSKLLNP